MRKCLVAVMTYFLLSACNEQEISRDPNRTPEVEPLITENQFVKYLEDNGFEISKFPSSLDSAGALVRVVNIDGFKNLIPVSHLLDCGMDPKDLYGKDLRLIKGVVAKTYLQGNNEFGFNFLAEVPSVTQASAEFADEYTQVVDIEKARNQRIDRLLVAAKLRDPLALGALRADCADAIEQGDAAVLVETVCIQSGKVSVVRKIGGEAGISLEKLKEILRFEAGGKAKFSEEGKIEFDTGEEDCIVVALKEAFYVPETGTLGGGAVDLQDATSDILDAVPLPASSQ